VERAGYRLADKRWKDDYSGGWMGKERIGTHNIKDIYIE